MYGKHFSDDAKEKIRQSKLGKKLSNEHKDNIGFSLKGKYTKENHWSYGKKLSEEHKQKISNSALKGSKHHNWAGNEVSYTALHDWVRRRLFKPEFCMLCEIKSPFELANISGKYKRDLTDWLWLCSKCHRIFDNQQRDKRGRFSKKSNRL